MLDEAVSFQSTPVIANGRITTAVSTCMLSRRFNPRPLLLTGESLVEVAPTAPRAKFQSTPVIANGRISCRATATRETCSFNPRPLLLTGESTNHCDRGIAGACFNPRPLLLTGESRVFISPPQHLIGFNPRPLLLTGESASPPRSATMTAVSIHARYC